MARLFSLGLAFLLFGAVFASPLLNDEFEEDTTSGPTKSDVCKGKGDGVLVADPADKAQFYECNNGLAFHFHCPSKLIFSESAKGCIVDPSVPPIKVPCLGNSQFDCTGKTDGFYPDPTDKTKFHECDHGCPYDFVCPPLTSFDTSRHVCASDSNVNPTTAAPHTDAPHTEPQTDAPHTEEHTESHTETPTQPPHTEGQVTDQTTPPIHEETTGTPHFVTPSPDASTTRGRHGGF